MFFRMCKKNSGDGHKPQQKQVRFSKPEQETPSISNSNGTLSADSLNRRFIELKLTFKKSHRRIVVDDRLSYNRLVKDISKTFGIMGLFSVYYEDDEKDIIKVSNTVEVRAMLLMSMRKAGCTHLFIRNMQQQ